MAILDISQVVRDYIHEGKQFTSDKKSAILTVNCVGRIAGAGALDFGGSEYSASEVITSERSPLRTTITVGPQGLSIKENARMSQVTALS